MIKIDGQLLKDVFFFIGSILGILAFCKSLLEPILEGNRRRWEEVKKRVDEEDFRSVEIQIWEARRVDDKYFDKIIDFVRDIENDAEYLRFGPILRKRYNQHLNQIRILYRNLREYIQTPYWEHKSDELEDKIIFRYWNFNKGFFVDRDPRSNEYVEHLYNASGLVQEMRIEFKKLSILSGLHIIELPFNSRIIKKRAYSKDEDVEDRKV